MIYHRRISLRWLMAVTIVTPVVVVCAVLLTLSTLTNSRIAHDLGDSYVQSAAASVSNRAGSYLSDAVRISDQYTRRIERGILPTEHLQAWEATMLDDLVTTPSIASICFGNTGGESTWLLINRGRMEVGRVSGPEVGQAVEFEVHADGVLEAEPIRRYQYDPRMRPWWAAALEKDGPTWTPIYFWFGETALDGTASTGYTRPIKDENGELRGVLIIDVTLGDIGQFLSELVEETHGYHYIVDGQNLIVATSHGSAMGDDGQRIGLSQHDSHAAGIAAIALNEAQKGETELLGNYTASLHHKGESMKVSVVQLNPYEGIDWRLITVLPESVFLEKSNAALQRGIGLSLIAILVGIFFSIALARWFSQPLLALTRQLRRVGDGDFDSRLNIGLTYELGAVSDAINHMAVDLKHRVQMIEALAVAEEVQQSLLPKQEPRCAAMDIAGRSRYCDETGGDYYDFITVRRDGQDVTLFAVGDVMGHGIAAALLMTSARAALRVLCRDEQDLGRMLGSINVLLEENAEHGAFMTLVLAHVDAERGRLTWSSAGHELPFVYCADQDRFVALEGSYVPLGILPDAEYEEFSFDGLAPGTVLLFGTDGLWEAANPDGELFGHDRVEHLLRECHHASAAQMAAAIEAALDQFRAGQPADDDMTFVVVKLLPVNPQVVAGSSIQPDDGV